VSLNEILKESNWIELDSDGSLRERGRCNKERIKDRPERVKRMRVEKKGDELMSEIRTGSVIEAQIREKRVTKMRVSKRGESVEVE
jgi:hypothetical protein